MKRIFLIFALSICLCLYACAKAAEYRDDVDPEDILKGAPHSVRSADDYTEYDDDFVEFFFGELPTSRDHALIYSKEQNDINEVGIFHASSEDETLEIYEKVSEYISEMRDTSSEEQ